MSELHAALQALGQVSYSSVPASSPSTLKPYLETHFASAQLLIESVPPLPSPVSQPASSLTPSRPRSNTASSASETSLSPARSSPLIPSHASLQREWGKPLRLSSKDNPLGMGVYKMSGKDGKGAWFARRSVHEGMGFRKWKSALEREFPESLEKGGAPGEGNVRGIGGERRLEREVVEGTGCMEVYHLSAQFPGPTAPRDFVTLLMTSSNALKPGEDSEAEGPHPRHYMIISKPCDHPATQPKDPFTRGHYESVEIIREVPLRRKPLKTMSAVDLSLVKDSDGLHVPLGKAAVLNRARDRAGSDEGISAQGNTITGQGPDAKEAVEGAVQDEARARGKTISFAESRGQGAKGEAFDMPADDDDEGEANPVEWIMITRSDPGGSVPRFMVERGTPAGICGDAVKFLNWACKKEDPVGDGALPDGRPSLDHTQTNGIMSGLSSKEGSGDTASTKRETEAASTGRSEAAQQEELSRSGIFMNLASVVYAGLETYAPQAVVNRLPGHSREASTVSVPVEETPVRRSSSVSSLASTAASFASADDHFSDSESESTLSRPKDKEMKRLVDRKAKADAKLQRSREKNLKDKAELTERDAARIRKAEEKHAREVQKAEERHAKEIKALEEKRQKDERKEAERKEKEEKRLAEKMERDDRESMRTQIEALRAERDLLQEAAKQLQAENTRLVAGMGKLEGGKSVLAEVKEMAEGGRSRSASLRSGRKEGSTTS